MSAGLYHFDYRASIAAADAETEEDVDSDAFAIMVARTDDETSTSCKTESTLLSGDHYSSSEEDWIYIAVSALGMYLLCLVVHVLLL